jgi:hypothetical protein
LCCDDEPEPEDEYPGFDNYGLKSECFIVSDNPVVARLYGPDGEELLTIYERDDRFGFLKWAEDR